jgi:DNA-binding IclR family transcriptional regulator
MFVVAGLSPRVHAEVEVDGGAMAGNSAEPGRTVTSKLAAILIAFTNGRDYTLSELAMQTNLATSTVHRLLGDLVRTSLFERPAGGSYRPGAALRSLPGAVDPPTLRARAPYVVEDLASALRTTARLGVVDGLEVAYIEKGTGSEPGSLFPNSARLPLHATAMGKALLAFGPRSRAQVVAGAELTRYTPRTLTCPSRLHDALHWTRTHGFAVTDRELRPTVGAIAVPVLDPLGKVAAAIEVDVLRPTHDVVERMLPALLTATRCLRRELAPAERPVRSAARETIRPAQVG